MGNRYARNILFIIPSYDWSTKERYAYRDLLLAKNHGYNVFLCTYEDSYIAKQLIGSEIELVPYQEHFVNRFTSFHKHFSLSGIIKKFNLDIIHCYDPRLLLSLSFQLKTENLVSLVVTQDHTIDKPLQQFWYQTLISRIDSLILVNKNLKLDAVGNLGLPDKKIDFFGMGIRLEENSDTSISEDYFSVYKNFFLAGTYVSPAISDVNLLEPLFSALKVLNQKISLAKKSKLVLLSAVDFQKLAIFQDLINLIKEYQLEEDVIFVTVGNVSSIIEKFDVWISHCPNALLEDYAISAVLHEVPVMLERNFCTKGFLEEFEGVGETFKYLDARELRHKWEKILLGLAIYKEKTRVYKFFIEREHSAKLYKTALLNLYSRIVLRRARLFRKK